MAYLRKIFFWAAILLCLAVAAPACADAPPGQTTKNKNSKNTAQKSASSQSTSVKKSAKNANAKKNANASSRVKKKRTKSKDKDITAQADSREIWLKRARESEFFSGKASWYGGKAHGGATASGVAYDMYTFTAAHRTLPIGTIVKVTDQLNGRSVMVCITDRGPYVRGRIIDLSYAAAKQINLNSRGVGPVDVEVVSDENGTPLNDDNAWYVRYNASRDKERVGPFRAFADAAAMHEALRQAHPEAEVVMDSAR